MCHFFLWNVCCLIRTLCQCTRDGDEHAGSLMCRQAICSPFTGFRVKARSSVKVLEAGQVSGGPSHSQ